MKSVTVIAISLSCVIALTNAGLITGSSKGPYNQGIIAATNRAKALSIVDLIARNAKQGDLAAFLTNIANFPLAYVHLLKKAPKQVIELVISTIRGLTKGQNIPESLQLATNNAVSRLQRAFSTDMSRVLTNGKEAGESKNAAEIIKEGDRAYVLGQLKRIKANMGSGDTSAAIHNLISLVSVVTQLGKGCVVEFPQLVEKVLGGTVYGLSKGLKKGGLLKAITSALKYSSKGLINGERTGFAHINRDTMRL